MDLTAAAEALAVQIGRQHDFAFVEALKLDIIAARTIAIKNEYLRTGKYDQSLIQNVNCLQFNRIYDKRCSTSDGFILRSTQKIPKPLLLGNTIFISLHNIYLNTDKRKSLDIIMPEDVQDIQYRTFTSKNYYAVYENERIDIVGENIHLLNSFKASLRGIFKNPIDVKKLKVASDNDEFCKQCEDCKNCLEEDEENDCFDTDTFEVEDYYFTDIQRIILAKRLSSYGTNDEIKINQ